MRNKITEQRVASLFIRNRLNTLLVLIMQTSVQQALRLFVPGDEVVLRVRVSDVDHGAFRPHLIEFYVDEPNNYHARTFVDLNRCDLLSVDNIKQT